MAYDILGAQSKKADADAQLSLWEDGGKKWTLTASGGALTISRGTTDVLVLADNTTSANALANDTASVKFNSRYYDNGATSGQATGDYLRVYGTGEGGGVIAQRSFATVSDVAAANAYGTHTSLSFGSTGTITGLGAGLYANILLPNTTPLAGTLTAINAEIYSDGATTDPAGATSLSVFRVVNGGNATGAADVDDDAVLFDFAGWTVGDGNMIAVKAAGAAPNVVNSIRIRLPDGSLGYIMVSASPLTA